MPLGSTDHARTGEPPPVRTVIVDDVEDVRILLRIVLGNDGRFDIVGEAGNGVEAVEVCGRLRPDLVVLDRHMPVMGGLEAIPLIRGRSPSTDIVLYTAAAEAGLEHAAATAGAIGVLTKSGVAGEVAQSLAQLLGGQRNGVVAAADDDIEVRVGPVASAAAGAWVANTRRILSALEDRPDLIGGPVSRPVMAMFERFLDAWESVARETDVFFWTGRAHPHDVREVVAEWARIDSMDEATLSALGCQWAPPEAQPFFAALTGAVVAALAEQDEARRVAERLGKDWSGARADVGAHVDRPR